MIIIDARLIEMTHIIILTVDAKSALVAVSILAYKAFHTEQVRGVILVCAIQGFVICKFLQFNHHPGIIQVVYSEVTEGVLPK